MSNKREFLARWERMYQPAEWPMTAGTYARLMAQAR